MSGQATTSFDGDNGQVYAESSLPAIRSDDMYWFDLTDAQLVEKAESGILQPIAGKHVFSVIWNLRNY